MDKGYFKDYYHLERHHWWFKGRLQILETILQSKVLKETRPLKILNVGVATGATSVMLEKYGEVTSVEYDKECCIFLKENLSMDVINASMTELPFGDRLFDVVCAFDVIEHIEDDVLALQEAYRVLKGDGKVYIAVPMHQYLWSDHDEINHHHRRYSSSTLQKAMSAAGYTTTYKTFFNSILYMPIAAVRLLSNLIPKKKEHTPKSDFHGLNTNSIVNGFLLRVLKFENSLLKNGLRFGFGVSKIVVGEKK